MWIENQAAYDAAVLRNIKANAYKTFSNKERAHEVEHWLFENSGKSSFAKSLLDALHTYGKLTDKQYDAVCRSIDTAEQKRKEWEAKRAAEAATLPPLKEGRYIIEGVIQSTKIIDGYYGMTYKMLVKLPCGNKVWGSVPDALKRGDEDITGKAVQFTAKVAVKEPGFGTYSRPTKAVYL